MSIDKAPFARRRQALLAAIGEGVAVLPAAPVFIRNNDVEHHYRQDSDFWYLTGFEEPESVLVLSRKDGQVRSTLFVRERDPERETWDGPRAGVDGAVEHYGVDEAFPIEELKALLPNYFVGAKRLFCRIGRGHPFDATLFEGLDAARSKTRRSGETTPSEIVDLGVALHELRIRKTEEEVSAMAAAAAITCAAHKRAMEFARPGMHEYEVEAEILQTFHKNGAPRVAYESIVGSGPNATILHYRSNRRRIEDGDLLLIDAGCELGYYASDVTRTFPVGARFTTPQRRLYEIVLRSQEACIEAVKPGVTLDDLHDIAVGVITEGLVEVGLLKGSVEDAIKNEAYKAFYMHRTSHWIGMDVHDVGSYFASGAPRPMEAGFVLTVEPGIYVSQTADVEEQWKGIGIRIEDDILVTDSGSRNLTAGVPKSVAEVEALTAG
ncbi:MAG: Xaa-Pro aminopeptidase [Myxococcota bacterium]